MKKIIEILATIAKEEKANGVFKPSTPLEREQIDYLYSMNLINLYELECGKNNCIVTLNNKGENLLRQLRRSSH